MFNYCKQYSYYLNHYCDFITNYLELKGYTNMSQCKYA